MSDNVTGIDRRSVLRKTGIGLASVGGVAMAAGSASATHLSVGDTVKYTPCSDCDDCYNLMEDPPNGDWSRTGPYACRGWETEVLSIYESSGEQFVELDFGKGPGWESEHGVEKV
ncbi:hypothetical protein [Natrinema altunense]|uniref:Uncharacterized protein n=2 Tax=Natrinema altunense TaxID=222984 RepID=L9ZV44_NATA2|nr:hypothetical protein [Natrinema altunense]ELY89008.1 hypothetical protein C485_05501 [Natrinema altunense JCM 12890]RZH67418.1 hypothetical protein ELS17_11140 [Natrinema altunense]